MVKEPFIDTLEFRRQSFIVRLWLDEASRAVGDTTWRGSITHVPSGDHKYVRDLEGITSFIAKYVAQFGAFEKVQRKMPAWLRWLHRNRSRITMRNNTHDSKNDTRA